MIPAFKEKLKVLQSEREEKWKPVKKIRKNISELKDKSKELNFVLDALGLPANKQNGYMKSIAVLQKRIKKYHPIAGTGIVDTVLEISRQNQYKKNNPINNKNFKLLTELLQDPKKAPLQYDIALAMAAYAIYALKNGGSYDVLVKYKAYLNQAFEILVKGEDADVFYAQWGAAIYQYIFKVSVGHENKEACIQECVDAYHKL